MRRPIRQGHHRDLPVAVDATAEQVLPGERQAARRGSRFAPAPGGVERRTATAKAIKAAAQIVRPPAGVAFPGKPIDFDTGPPILDSQNKTSFCSTEHMSRGGRAKTLDLSKDSTLRSRRMT